MLIVLCVRSTVPAAATLSSGLVICRLLVSAMPFLMVKAPPRSLNAVLFAGTLAHFRDLTLADLADHLGEVDAVDRAVAHGEAALALQRGLYLFGVRARAGDLEGELGVAFEHAELRGVARAASWPARRRDGNRR